MSQNTPLAELFDRLRAEVREARFSAVLDEARAWAERQDAMSAAAFPASPDFPASWPLKLALDDILRWRDADFVHACYQAILRRPPDPAGFAAHLNDVRSGRSRAEIAVGFVESEEGRRAGVQVAGANRAAFYLRLGRIPVLGYFLRAAKAVVMLPRQLRERDAAEAYLLARIALVAGEGRRVRLEAAWLHERLARNLGARLARLADQSQDVLDRLPAAEAAISRVSASAKADLATAAAGLRAELTAARAGVEKALDLDSRDGRVAALEAQLRAVQDSATQMRAEFAALPFRETQARFDSVREDVARLGESLEDLARRLDRETAHSAAQDAQMKAVRVAGVEELNSVREGVARLGESLEDLANRLDRETAHSAAQDAQMKAVREVGVEELTRSASALEARLTELVTREGELLERRVGERLASVSEIERDVEALRAALATFRKKAAR